MQVFLVEVVVCSIVPCCGGRAELLPVFPWSAKYRGVSCIQHNLPRNSAMDGNAQAARNHLHPVYTVHPLVQCTIIPGSHKYHKCRPPSPIPCWYKFQKVHQVYGHGTTQSKTCQHSTYHQACTDLEQQAESDTKKGSPCCCADPDIPSAPLVTDPCPHHRTHKFPNKHASDQET